MQNALIISENSGQIIPNVIVRNQTLQELSLDLCPSFSAIVKEQCIYLIFILYWSIVE